MHHQRPKKGIPRHIVGTVAMLSLLVSNCSSGDCDSPGHPFTLDQQFSEAALQDYLTAKGVERMSVECESFCELRYALDADEFVDSVSSCMLSIEPLQGEEPDDVAGTIQCEGEAVEHHCK